MFKTLVPFNPFILPGQFVGGILIYNGLYIYIFIWIMRPLNLILLVVHWGFPYIKDINGLWSSLKGSGIPRQPSNRARRRPRPSPGGHWAWRLRHGWGTWRQNETRRDVHQEKWVVEWWNDGIMRILHIYLRIYLINLDHTSWVKKW